MELDEVDVVDSLTEVNPFSLVASPISFIILVILPDRFRVTGGRLGLCVFNLNPGGAKPGECDEAEVGVEVMLKLPGDSL